MSNEENANPKCDRRDFMGKAGVSAFLTAMGLAGAGSLVGLSPSVLPDPSKQLKIGPPQDYPSGTVRVFDEEKVVVISDDEGIYALSLVCTHLGCVVTLDRGSGQFDCPCHGSKFTMEGEVTKAPAPRSLDRYEVSLLPGGQMMVDQGVRLDSGEKLKV
ncbi:MAG: Rieske (2Fe-2S) protein [Kiritimatiellia bacterium]|jgi:cytochrome b6-f complex iron-sulfur subunit|nr:Rieske (2Fe-2S) protein [Kiritimatiellia bacterium]